MGLTAEREQEPRAADALVGVSTKLHPEARRKLRMAAAENDQTIAEAVRSIIYDHFGLSHLPVREAVESTASR